MENEIKDEIMNESPDDYNYAINTASIYWNESKYNGDPDFFNVKMCPVDLAMDLEHAIQELLVKHIEPTVDYSDHMKEYLLERFKKFKTTHFSVEPFRLDFFVTAYDKPRIKRGSNDLRFSGDNYFYLYDYHEPFIAYKKAILDSQFELIFAFALRQCDLMNIDSFLSYHLLANFEGNTKQYCKYLTQINRKFTTPLFTNELSNSIRDWLSENENKADVHISRKIKTYLTIDQLACLFKMLMDNGHLSDEPTKTIEVVCASFETKMMRNPSSNNFGQDFYKPTIKALDFWIDNFDKMSKRAIRLKQKFEA